MRAKSSIWLSFLSGNVLILITCLFSLYIASAQDVKNFEIPLILEKSQEIRKDLLPEPYVDGRRIKFSTYEEDFLRITLRPVGRNNRITVHDGFLIDGEHEIILDWSRFRSGFYIIEIHSSKYLVRKQIRLI
jgi:hypothetical protein